MAFRGVTFQNQLVKENDDGGIYRAVFAQDGVLWGCGVTYSGETVTVAPGMLVMGGRVIAVDGATSVAMGASAITSGYARLSLRIDLNQIATITEFAQIETFWDTSSTAEFLAYTQEEINYNGSIYEQELCVVQVSGGTIASVVRSLGSAVINAAQLGGEPPGYYMPVPGGTFTGTVNAEHILPTETNGWHLGSTDLRWKSVCAHKLDLAGSAAIAGSVTAGNILPVATNGYDLGSTDLRWKNVYVQTLDLSGGLTLAGTLTARHIVPSVTNGWHLGNTSFRWKGVYAHSLDLAESATIAGGVSAASLDLSGSATVAGNVTAQRLYAGETLLAVQNTGDGRLYVGSNANGTVVSGSGNLLLQTYSSNGARRDGISITADEVTRIYAGSASAGITLQGKETQCRNYDNTAYAPLACSVVNEASSLRYKDVTGDMPDAEADKLLSVEVKEFTYKSDEAKQPHFGVIAEQLDEIGLTSLVAYDEEGRPDAVGYSRIAPYLINLVQRQQKRIEALEARLTALEERNG